MSSRVTRACLLLIVLSLGSGLLIGHAESWSRMYVSQVLLHPVAGCAGLLLLAPALLKKSTAKAGPPRARRTCRLALFACVLSLLTGLLLLPIGGLPSRIPSLARLHGALSILLFLGLAGWLILRSLAPAGEAEEGSGAVRALARFAARASLLIPALFILDGISSRRQPSFTAHLTSVLDAKRALEPDETMPASIVNLLDEVERCGVDSRCHLGMVEEFRRSTHDTSYSAPYLQKNLTLLENEIGRENTALCSGCHTPLAVLRGDTSYEGYARKDNMSCLFCHSVSGVDFPEDRRVSAYTLTANLDHLSLFEGDERRFKTVTVPLILLNPRGHARALTRPVQKTDPFCLACHHLQLRAPPRDQTFRSETCVGCHMQESSRLHGAGTWKNHYFPGSNTALPKVSGRDEDLAMMLRWLSGDMILFERPSVWDLSPGNRKPYRKKEIWLWMSCELAEPLRPGGKAAVVVRTSNVGIGHPFPAAAIDLVEAWQEILVTEGGGRVVHHGGWVGEDTRIDPEAHRLGGYMLDENHQVLEKNRVWFITKKILTRTIGMGEETSDTYGFDIPEDATGPIKVVARWNYRKLNPDFVEWAFDGETVSMPVAEVGRVEAEFPLVDPSGNG